MVGILSGGSSYTTFLVYRSGTVKLDHHLNFSSVKSNMNEHNNLSVK
jgi:poly-D-alanine transfer protein DltD